MLRVLANLRDSIFGDAAILTFKPELIAEGCPALKLLDVESLIESELEAYGVVASGLVDFRLLNEMSSFALEVEDAEFGVLGRDPRLEFAVSLVFRFFGGLSSRLAALSLTSCRTTASAHSRAITKGGLSSSGSFLQSSRR